MNERGILMDEAIEYAKNKIKMFPEIYKDYANDFELFKLLVEDCRKQLEAENMSLSYLKLVGGKSYEQSII